MVKMATVIIYDGLNNQWWLDYGKGGRFGKFNKYRTREAAKKAAYAEARKRGLKVYNKLEGRQVTPRAPAKRRRSSYGGFGFGGRGFGGYF